MAKLRNPNKRVCIILVKDMQEGQDPDNMIKAGERVMRTTESFAQQMIATGYWAYTNKSKLKSFLNKNAKLTRNMYTLDRLQTLSGETYPEKREGSKVVCFVPAFRIDLKKGNRIAIEVPEYGHTIEHRYVNGAGVMGVRKQHIRFKDYVVDKKTGKIEEKPFPTKQKYVKRAIKRDPKTFRPIDEPIKFTARGNMKIVLAFP